MSPLHVKHATGLSPEALESRQGSMETSSAYASDRVLVCSLCEWKRRFDAMAYVYTTMNEHGSTVYASFCVREAG